MLNGKWWSHSKQSNLRDKETKWTATLTQTGNRIHELYMYVFIRMIDHQVQGSTKTKIRNTQKKKKFDLKFYRIDCF